MTGPAIRCTIAGLSIVASRLLATLSASAETPQQRDWCYGKNDATPEMQIAGCTAFIASSDHDDVARADAFNNRGAGYAAREEWDRALDDYSVSVKLDPTVASTFYNRGLAYLQRAGQRSQGRALRRRNGRGTR
jgi:tetratricopeptide (TPR) repeat protein